jgi:hypothetical protein
MRKLPAVSAMLSTKDFSHIAVTLKNSGYLPIV